VRDLPAVRCVVFDLGGVLVRIVRSWAEACEAAGLPVRTDGDDPARVLARRPLVEDYDTGRIGRDDFFRGVAAACGHAYDVGEIARIHAAWLLGEYPRVGEVLDAVHAAGAATAVLSNTNEAHWETMLPPDGTRGRFPSLRRVRHPLASHLLGARKPQPRAYAAVEAACGATGAEVLFFDDLPENVAAARARGWRSEVVDPLGDPARQMLEVLRRGMI
jgi:2-haloacid dehalogenase